MNSEQEISNDEYRRLDKERFIFEIQHSVFLVRTLLI